MARGGKTGHPQDRCDWGRAPQPSRLFEAPQSIRHRAPGTGWRITMVRSKTHWKNRKPSPFQPNIKKYWPLFDPSLFLDSEPSRGNRRFYVLSPRLETLTCGLHPVKLTIYKDEVRVFCLTPRKHNCGYWSPNQKKKMRGKGVRCLIRKSFCAVVFMQHGPTHFCVICCAAPPHTVVWPTSDAAHDESRDKEKRSWFLTHFYSRLSKKKNKKKQLG